ncbi:MAG: urea ABC transporter ATP-binding protein UrtD [Kiritimatiellae bacterium]|nr:urea ABC transporter ATP-binding protein UrtD [Kiritimatiellia bacterium]MDW8459367.1 urea ABC transporter ATP-binding protein UrtD [Verrucomicrobiota bacterium]
MESLLYLEDVHKSFDGFKAIDGLSFALVPGELRVIIGPNGAGKSTLLDLITGRLKPDSGKILFREIDLTRLNEWQINRLGIGRKFQTPSVYGNHTVYENLLLSLPRRRNVSTALFARETREEKARIEEILEEIGLAEKRGVLAGSLAHGEKQWLEIGMLLVQSPELLLVDEPAAGMTDAETEKTAELLLRLEGRHTLVVIEHDMEFVRDLNRRITVLHQGAVLCEGNMDFIQQHEEVRRVYLGEESETAPSGAP